MALRNADFSKHSKILLLFLFFSAPVLPVPKVSFSPLGHKMFFCHLDSVNQSFLIIIDWKEKNENTV